MKLSKQRIVLKLFSLGFYKCTKSGEVISVRRGNTLSGSANNSGYLGTHLSCRPMNLRVCGSIHQFIWLYFNGQIPKGKEINHKNCKKTDNRLCNLELVTRSENNKHALRNGRIKPFDGDTARSRILSRKDILEIRRLISNGVMQKDIAKRFGVAKNTISGINTGSSWSKIF